MEIAVLGDLHFGCRGDSQIHLDYQEKFFSEVFFPEIDRRGIKIIWQLGDFMDRRKFVNYNTLARTKAMFLDECEKRGLTVYCLVGNHDIFYRESIRINSLDQLFQSYMCVRTVEKPTTFEFDGVLVDMLPWICEENETEVAEFMGKSTSDVLLGHLELVGFDMLKGIPSEHGMQPSSFDKYSLVLSGHYHTRSTKGNIEYLGTPYEITWADCEDQKGFGIFDTKTMTSEFVENPFHIFSRIIYNDEEIDYDKVELSKFRRSYLKIIIAKRNSIEMFDRFLERLWKLEPVDISISDTTMAYTEVEQDKIETRDPLTILVSSVDDTMEDAKEVRRLIADIHTQALSSGVEE
jgi:DNA repair exonuclease SbcCD nuclease subunit